MKKIKYFIPSILFMIIIFWFSHQTGTESSGLSTYIVNWLENHLHIIVRTDYKKRWLIWANMPYSHSLLFMGFLRINSYCKKFSFSLCLQRFYMLVVMSFINYLLLGGLVNWLMS